MSWTSCYLQVCVDVKGQPYQSGCEWHTCDPSVRGRCRIVTQPTLTVGRQPAKKVNAPVVQNTRVHSIAFCFFPPKTVSLLALLEL